MIEIPIRDLSRHQQDRLQRRKAFGELAEELVAEEYGITHAPDEERWYDCRNENTGAKTEVKSTSSTVGDKYPGTGRFRVWRAQHRSLVASDAAGVAWYAFVLLDEEDGVIRIRRAKPSTVTQWVRDRDGWNDAGHQTYSHQQKIPHTEVF